MTQPPIMTSLAMRTTSRAEGPGTYESVQALRGIAALIVTIFHAGLRFDPAQSTFRVGNAGVDIFFVISGFVIWTVTIRRPAPPVVFLQHRFVRLVPMYWLVTLVVAALSVAVPSAFPHMHTTPRDILLSLAFIPHVSPSTGAIEPMLGQGWTLNFEMFFYVLLAVVLLLPQRVRFGAIGAALLVLALLGLALQTPSVPPTTLLSPLLIEFFSGLLLARLAAAAALPRAPWCWVAVAIGVGALVGLTAPPAADDLLRLLKFGVPAFLIVGGAVGLEAAGHLRIPAAASVLGAASYSLYLTHPFAIGLLGKLWPNSLPAWAFMAVATLLAVLVGLGAYTMVEKPLLMVMRGRRRPALAKLSALP